jgi:probable selenium-dependent hydroxylase accessory protein YqeC
MQREPIPANFAQFGLSPGGVTALVGAGGKTTLLFALARALAGAGKTVLTTTTTKIYPPSRAQSPKLILSRSPVTICRIARELRQKTFHVTAAAGRIRTPGGTKLSGLSRETVDALTDMRCFDHILVEADGAAGRPMKAPASGEPVFPESTTGAIAVAGLLCIDKPLTSEFVHRPDIFTQLTGCRPAAPVTPAHVAAVLTHENGLFQGCPESANRTAYLSPTDTPARLAAAREIAELLTGSKPTIPVIF